MKCSLKFSLNFTNSGKKDSLDKLWLEYKKALQIFLKKLFLKQGLDENFIKAYQSQLSYRYKQCAKRQALKIFKSWCRIKKRKNKPKLRKPSLNLDYRFVELQKK